MAYAISWTGTQTGKECFGPPLYKHIEIKGELTRKKVLMTREEAEKLCENANYDPLWNGLEHKVVKVKERENLNREIPDEKILGGKFWRKNTDMMIPGKRL